MLITLLLAYKISGPINGSEQCTSCYRVLGKLVKRHSADNCPLYKSKYCGLCASYGHSPRGCPDVITRSYREPHFLEQLIPSSLLIEYNIQSQTPITSHRIPEPSSKIILEVPETEEAIRAAIVAAGQKPMICQEKGRREKKEMTENKKKLQKIADAAGKKLVYVKDSVTVLIPPTPQKKYTIKKAGETAIV